MIYLTGDCHADFTRFSKKRFPEQSALTKKDVVIILGDAGFVWDGSREENYWLDWLAARPFTVLNVGGNHENYELLDVYPAVPFAGGMAREIRPGVFQLERGYVYQIDEHSVFTFGGAQSHDVQCILPRGLDPEVKRQLRRRGVPYREEGVTWFPQEMPSPMEYARARENLRRKGGRVDLVLTHCAPASVQAGLVPDYPVNELTDFLEELAGTLDYGAWFCGHYHRSAQPTERFRVLYEEIIPIPNQEAPYEI